MRPILSTATPAAKIFYLCILLIPCALVASTLIFFIMNTAGESAQTTLWAFYASMLIQGTVLFILPAYLVIAMTNAQPIAYLKLNRDKRIGCKMLFGILTFVAIYAFVLFLVHWNRGIELPESMHAIEQWMRAKEDAAMKTTGRLLSVQTVTELIMNILIIGVVASVAEEIIFRGALQQFLQEWTRNGHVAVWITAFIFSTVHFQFFGFFPRLVLGALLGYLFLYTRNLWVPIFVHFFNNVLVVIVNYIWRDSEWLKNAESIEITPTFAVWAIVSIGITVWLFAVYVKRNSQNTQHL
jgi:membrane protease YdiL (CAAX protease family)